MTPLTIFLTRVFGVFWCLSQDDSLLLRLCSLLPRRQYAHKNHCPAHSVLISHPPGSSLTALLSWVAPSREGSAGKRLAFSGLHCFYFYEYNSNRNNILVTLQNSFTAPAHFNVTRIIFVCIGGQVANRIRRVASLA